MWKIFTKSVFFLAEQQCWDIVKQIRMLANA